MKVFSIASLGLAAAELARLPRQAGQGFELDGSENSDELMSLILEIAGDAKDEVDEAIQAMMGVDRNMDERQVRKFRGLKILTLWLLKEAHFGKFCYYGCFCLPEGSHDIADGGYGRPLDNIDAACFDFKKCYKCLIDEFDGDFFVNNQFNMGHITKAECAGEELGYRHTLDVDGSGARSITCTNPVGSCRRSICECDKKLAESFAEYESEWDERYHTTEGGFIRDDHCVRQGGTKFEDCCGDKTTFPFNQPRHSHQCCDGNEAKDAGMC